VVGSAARRSPACARHGDAGSPFRLVLTDSTMPDMDGFQWWSESGNPRFETVAYHGDFRGASVAMRPVPQLSIAAYLTKPVRGVELKAVIRATVGRASDDIQALIADPP